ncbi:lymphatic vessel endothelial hyaluronic acid receptor 1 [Hyla sarda]|uniref:lymphatic vessel endothelial hyaluronic acid receptor 1 n=1 Tax=Hyla sarda TaxID=327740 RepID=UPI0024C225E0|nr:lymphatic vessel endothelial hyaluronic acid receptor 1 [Hyla sarda]
MSHHFGVLFALLSLILGGHLLESSFDVADLKQPQCRIAGVTLVQKQDKSTIFNYTMAESACQALGLQLANKEQMEKARGYGYETCSFGWVSDKVGAIPRIQHNEKCGNNKTGVLTWTVNLSRTFAGAYCFNVSDVRINSCKPGLMVTEPPSTVLMPTSGSTTASATTSLKTETQTDTTLMSTARVRTTPDASTTSLYTTLMTTTTKARKPQTTTLQATTLQTTTLQTTPPEDTEPPTKQENQMAQKTERIIFGGLPTTLLILALVFFVAAVGLAVCYIKKYKTHLLFTTKKHQKESVETKVFKDTSGAENTSGEERYTNLHGAESPHYIPGNSIEAEV